MTPKHQYTVEYAGRTRKDANARDYSTDDPVACEEFIEELLEQGCPIHAIKHNGTKLPRRHFDRMVRNAAGMLASRHICSSLRITGEEEKYRFGFAA